MNKKGFTLIELLAVIIILGVLMVIAIPAVTTYIQNSRKSAYISTAKEVVGSTRNLVNSGKLDIYDTSATYYIPSTCIKLENADVPISPYGKFRNAYVIVGYNESNFSFYWRSVDETGHGIKDLTSFDDLDTDLVESDVKISDVLPDQAIAGKENIIIFNDDCTEKVGTATVDAATTTDNKTWTYKDLRMTIDLHLNQCNEQGDYIICYNASIDVSNIGETATIKDFNASFNVPSGTIIVDAGYDRDKVNVSISGNVLSVVGNPSKVTWNYLVPSGTPISTGFQIKFPKTEEFKLTNGVIRYTELVSGIQEGESSSGLQGNASDMTMNLSRLRIRLERTGYYTSNDRYVSTYNVYVTNLTESDITDWSFTLEAPNEIVDIYSYSPLMYSKNGNTYVFTPFEHDQNYRTLSPGEVATYSGALRFETTNTNALPVIR